MTLMLPFSQYLEWMGRVLNNGRNYILFLKGRAKKLVTD